MYVNYQEVLYRAETGPLMKESDFDRKVSKVARDLVKKYDLKYNPAIVVNYDDDIADRFFEAALDFLVEVGVYVTEYQRVIKFT
ncbi:MAG: monomethylamine:corrinoid methyltransferase, partial [Clostridiales bacterium]